MSSWRRRRAAVSRDATERSWLQYNMIRSIAFGERDWIVLYSLFCFVSPAPRDFWTIAGVSGFTFGIFLLGPIYGVMIHGVTKMLYSRLKAKGAPPVIPNSLAWQANALSAPFIVGVSWLMFDGWFSSVASVLAQILGKK